MLVSAISTNNIKNLTYYGLRPGESASETTFNSLTPASLREETSPEEKQLRIFESINEWKNFCQKQVIGEKLNVIA